LAAILLVFLHCRPEMKFSWKASEALRQDEQHGKCEGEKLNRLVSILANINDAVEIDFVYDGLGRLRTRTDEVPYFGETLVIWTTYIYDGFRVIQEREGFGNSPAVSYTRGNDLSGSLEGAGGIGGLLSRSSGYNYSSGNPTTHNYYFADGNGNVTYMLNSSQSMVASYRYDPFGNTISSSGTLANDNVYRFSSKEFHVNSGMYYFGYRFYDPNLQRWINRDPICDAGFLRGQNNSQSAINQSVCGNEYQYSSNDPNNDFDFLGLCTVITSGRGTVTGGLWTVIRHHPFFHTHYPPATESFSLQCPSSQPYLVLWGLATSDLYSPPFDDFPSGWSGSVVGTSGSYSVSINLPSRTIIFGYNLAGLYIRGCCSCRPTPYPRIPRVDPPAPPTPPLELPRNLTDIHGHGTGM
jgi:RHS repeat-associated protein